MIDILRLFDLQFFADAGTSVNAQETMTNAYTGETTNRTSTNSMSGELKEFYDTELLENTRVELFYAQFGKKQPLPKNHKGQVEWRKWNTFPRADKLQEAVIPTGKAFGMTTLTGSIDQYGMYTAISDKLELRAYDDVILGATEEMGASAAETQEALIRNALYAGTNVLYADDITLATGAFHQAVTAEKGLNWGSTYGCPLTPDTVNRAVTIMKKNRVPRINNKYYAVIHPSVAHDLRNSEYWIEAHKYAATEQIFNGEIGELHGCRFIENVFAPVFKGADLCSTSETLTAGETTSGAKTSITYSASGVTIAEDELVGRKIMINGVVATVTGNKASDGDHTISFASTTFGSITSGTTKIYPGEHALDNVACYATYFFGKDAFGIIDPEGGALEMIVHDKGQAGGPLEQFSTIGYKFETNGATILYPERLLRVMSTSTFSATDESNE